MTFNLLLAQELLASQVAKYRALPYSELAEKILRGDIDTCQTDLASVTYRFEVRFFWDDEPYNNIYVTASVFSEEPGSASVTDEFVLSPHGKFLGERLATSHLGR